MKACLACKLNQNPKLVPGGRISETRHWIVEHCIGPYGLDTLIVKTRKHKEQFSQLTTNELAEFAQLMKTVHLALEEIIKPDQIYVNRWGEETPHLHFLIQPVSKKTKQEFRAHGPLLQAKMLKLGIKPDPKKATLIAEKLKQWFTNHNIHLFGF